MNKKQLKEFKQILEAQREALLSKEKGRTGSDFTVDKEEIKDEVDHASIEISQSIEIRLRGREKMLCNKIDEALKKLELGEFGVCEDCGDDIDLARLKARPITKLCISCKETQEQSERLYA